MTEQEQSEAVIRFAAEVKHFLGSNVARFVFDRAAENVDNSVERLKTVDPDDSKLIRDIQYDIKLNSTVGLWLKEMLQAGMDEIGMSETVE